MKGYIYLVNDKPGTFFNTGDIVEFVSNGILECYWCSNGKVEHPVSIERLNCVGKI